MKKNPRLFLLVGILVLEALPWSAVLNFANPEGTPFHRTYSYFSMMPFGYGNVGPLITAVLTCALVLLEFWNFKKPVGKVMAVVSCIAVVASVLPLLFGFEYMSVLGYCIWAGLVLNTCLLIVDHKKGE